MPEKQTYPVQLVQPDGRRVFDREHAALVADVDAERLRQLYQDMVVTRRIDLEATALQRQGQLGLWPPLLGQEAAQVGSAHALHPDDYVFCSYRETAVAYCRGVAPEQLTTLWRGVAHHCWDPDSVNMTNANIVVGSQGLHATGYAYAAHLDGADMATIAYFGDGATSQGDIAEALGFAAAWSAPVVFFCQNNQWAISEPVAVQSHVPLVRRADGYGIPGVQVDGNDVLAVLAVTRQAVERARTGGGPTFVEAMTYRMGPHTTADDPSRYRTAADTEYWEHRDPTERLRLLLDREGLLDPEFQRRVTETADDVARRVRTATTEMPDPDPLRMFDNVYATEHPLLAEEARQFAAHLAEGAQS
ncbi:pyruvate dehydrogenase (acetyl-transferring) E1 component subunit alpha [Nocardia asteroides NBRC 15531]|uniref:Branched-chain alpha-keto acid dehydrogenase E1 alpha subunit n=1 Tax=Nocardia asteroides NBRC 15531 TaxID=1110697 RepID=U5EN97_NOCAS|nr:pyruvate dehydrogenase (acetyl-transferring) E1 component subunit alpha [Nocardia asteroides]TLF65734.1 pyruvate dehydrogenase (acetyl-transferring) E1 component subunit alpha [Nocardia asteroides NBRC 15531]UGT47494.1 pyruvate dehydrogenase (acetyl-transferring) E1 component subunit alpha [Nocardia asteroides]SFM46674.1 pyruvate dehydrogenase E1 component alpha subunit [Nocardia asteroides]VEG33600.1 Pyruvate dehydrogenase E1 component subunit alpha [Nocardia asteroides]GAD87841.1 branched